MVVSWGVVDTFLYGTHYVDLNNPRQKEMRRNEVIYKFLVEVPLSEVKVLHVFYKHNTFNLRGVNLFLCKLIATCI